MPRILLPGKPYPLGATWDGTGVNFTVYSENADKVELCLYDNCSRQEVDRIDVRETMVFVWHCYIPGLQPGQLYGYRVQGPWDPQNGLRFNPSKLLIDPLQEPFKPVSINGSLQVQSRSVVLLREAAKQ